MYKRQALERVNDSIAADMPEDFYSIDLMDAYEALGDVYKRQHFLCGLSGPLFSSIIEYMILLCTGFKPSLTSGRARDAITLIA